MCWALGLGLAFASPRSSSLLAVDMLVCCTKDSTFNCLQTCSNTYNKVIDICSDSSKPAQPHTLQIGRWHRRCSGGDGTIRQCSHGGRPAWQSLHCCCQEARARRSRRQWRTALTAGGACSMHVTETSDACLKNHITSFVVDGLDDGTLFRRSEDGSDPTFVCERVCTSDRLLRRMGGLSKDPTPNTCVTVCGISGTLLHA